MSVYVCPKDSQFFSYGELLSHAKSLTQDELKRPVMCQIEDEDDSFPIVKFKKIEDSRIHLVSGTHKSSDSRKWKTWADLLDYLTKLADYQLNWFVYIADTENHYLVSDITKTKYPLGFISSGTTDFNILVIDQQDFLDQ